MYLETATIPPDYIPASRRVNYLHNIISRSESELVKRVFNVQKENPSKEDWCHIVKQDMTLINLFMTEKEIADYSKRELKAIVKKHVTSAAIESLTLKQSGHIKIKHIKYQNNKVKPYLRSNFFHLKNQPHYSIFGQTQLLGTKCASQVFMEMTSLVNWDVLKMIQLIIYILV